MSADPNCKPAWVGSLPEHAPVYPTKFIRYDFSGKPYKCKKDLPHSLPCGGIICEYSDGSIRTVDDTCACGCDAYEMDYCGSNVWTSI